MLFLDKVLKIQDVREEADNEKQAMQWLDGRLSVPGIIAHEKRMEKLLAYDSRILKTYCDG
ncbi:MAG: hypothetical protein J1E01_00440 [Acetatifactor sp.]|nr:hypothetical protein [Acetatifactor sp.]